MKAAVIALLLLAFSVSANIVYDVWDLFLRHKDCTAVQATGPREHELVSKGRIPCPIEK